MPPLDLSKSDSVPEGITRQDILDAIRDLDAGVGHAFLDSHTFDVVHGGERYPPKAVVGLAARRVLGRSLDPSEFRGERGSKAFRLLKRCGFLIEPKPLGPAPEFEVGQRYHRQKEIHDRFGGQRQGGMSTPKDYHVVFLFTGDRGRQHGYRDEMRADGTFWYTGEGQKGNMRMTKCNRALHNHHALGKRVHLFEDAGRRHVRYIGEVEYLGHHHEDRPDRDGDLRSAIVFELALLADRSSRDVQPPSSPAPEVPLDHRWAKSLRKKPLGELRRLALAPPPRRSTPEAHRRNVYQRSEAVREYVLKRAGGTCEGCGAEAPFTTKDGRPYLEPHHTTRLADGGPDHPAHVLALCPTCHRRVHYGKDGEVYNAQLKRHLVSLEPE